MAIILLFDVNSHIVRKLWKQVDKYIITVTSGKFIYDNPLFLNIMKLFFRFTPIKKKGQKLTPYSLLWVRDDVIYYPLPPRRYKPFLVLWFHSIVLPSQDFKFIHFLKCTLNSILEKLPIYRAYIMDEGVIYCRGFFIIFGLDALLSDDEPLWEPIEWSLVQTWLFFIFLFAWIGENLISARFGSYVGRDKRVWLAWYKAFWFIEAWYLISYGSASLFIIVPFYYEITYSIAFLVSWWDWYTRVFVFKFVSFLFLLLYLGTWLLLNVRWVGWQKLFIAILGITFSLMYLFYFQFITTTFAYFTDPLWYQKSRFNDFVQLSHEPNKWGWGHSKRDHFTYHRVSTVFWFKNDGPFAGAFLMINLFFLLTLFFNILFWIVLLRKTYYLKEVHYTFLTYCVSSLRHLLYLFLMIYVLVFFSFVISYWRFPPEFFWAINRDSWFNHLVDVLLSYFL